MYYLKNWWKHSLWNINLLYLFYVLCDIKLRARDVFAVVNEVISKISFLVIIINYLINQFTLWFSWSNRCLIMYKIVLFLFQYGISTWNFIFITCTCLFCWGKFQKHMLSQEMSVCILTYQGQMTKTEISHESLIHRGCTYKPLHTLYDGGNNT